MQLMLDSRSKGRFGEYDLVVTCSTVAVSLSTKPEGFDPVVLPTM
jgi:hypothetical protein